MVEDKLADPQNDGATAGIQHPKKNQPRRNRSETGTMPFKRGGRRKIMFTLYCINSTLTIIFGC